MIGLPDRIGRLRPVPVYQFVTIAKGGCPVMRQCHSFIGYET